MSLKAPPSSMPSLHLLQQQRLLRRAVAVALLLLPLVEAVAALLPLLLQGLDLKL
jgi:hypothetical protein